VLSSASFNIHDSLSYPLFVGELEQHQGVVMIPTKNIEHLHTPRGAELSSLNDLSESAVYT
jgi:hypothetical protein